MTQHAIEAAIATALQLPRGDDAIASVKSIVRTELERMDPDVVVRETQYFNHTFAPDFVLTWRSGKRQSHRDLFLRSSLLSSTMLDDFAALGRKASADQTAPALLALTSDVEEEEVREIAQAEVGLAPEVLLMDVGAWDDIAAAPAKTTPVRTLVERNLVRGGRGLIVEGVAAQLVTVAQPGNAGIDVDEFSALVNDTFIPEAALRIQRAAQLLGLAFGDQWDLIQPELGENAEALGGVLSESETHLLVPYLLTADGVTEDVRFWRHLGRMMSLAQIEEMTHHLVGLDLTRLVVPNLYTWTASRSAVSIYMPEDALDDDEYESEVEPEAESSIEVADSGVDSKSILDPIGKWHIRSRMLSTVVGDLRVFVTADGRRLKARDDAPPARWENLSRHVGEFNLRAVELSGLQRRVSISAETDAGVLADVTAIRDTIADDFHVPTITLMAGDESAMEVSFVHGQVTGSHVRVGDLVRAALLLLGHRTEIDRDVLDGVAPPEV